jgi:DNA repair protein RadC
MKIKEMPVYSMPREKLLYYGVENLSNADLLSIILRNGTKEYNAIDIANNILNKVGSINNLSNIGIRELSNIKGVGNIKAITILASIELGKRVYNREIVLNMSLTNSKIVHDTFKSHFKNLHQEKFMAIYLDTKKSLINYRILFVGTIDQSVVHPREIFSEAIKLSASSIIVMHNHPSGSLIPSRNDIETTNKLIESGKLIGIPVLDSIITNGEEYYSINDTK